MQFAAKYVPLRVYLYASDDHNRVLLKTDRDNPSDYINASHIRVSPRCRVLALRRNGNALTTYKTY